MIEQGLKEHASFGVLTRLYFTPGLHAGLLVGGGGVSVVHSQGFFLSSHCNS